MDRGNSSVRYGIPRWFNGTGDLHLNLSQEGEGSGAESLDGPDGNLNVNQWINHEYDRVLLSRGGIHDIQLQPSPLQHEPMTLTLYPMLTVKRLRREVPTVDDEQSAIPVPLQDGHHQQSSFFFRIINQCCSSSPSPRSAKLPASGFTPTKHQPPLMHINSMPNDCLVALFNVFPTRELVHLRRVHTRWNEIIRGMRYSRRSLKLFTSENDIPFYEDKVQLYHLQSNVDFKISPNREDIMVATYRPGLCYTALRNLLLFLYPNLDSLIIFTNALTRGNTFPTSYILTELLHYSPQLTSFTIFGVDKGQLSLPTEMWIRLEQHRSLKRLYLFDLYTCSVGSLADSTKAVLRRLEELTIINYHGFVHPILNEVGGQSFHKLNLNSVMIMASCFQTFLGGENSLLANRLRDFSLGYVFPFERELWYKDDIRAQEMFEILKEICTRCTEMVNFNIGFATSLSIEVITRELAKLPKLESLRLVVGLVKWTRLELNAIYRKVGQLPSVKRIHFDIINYVELLGFLVNNFFPNVEEITLQCDDEAIRVWVEGNVHISDTLGFRRFDIVEPDPEVPCSVRLVRKAAAANGPGSRGILGSNSLG